MSDCKAVQYSDQMSCECGNVWDVNDPDPPKCESNNKVMMYNIHWTMWYSVDEITPPENTLILYHAPGIFDPSNPAIWVGQYEADTGCFFSRSGFFCGGEVTHWMPIPDPKTGEVG